MKTFQLKCDLCDCIAQYDGATKLGGVWAYMCQHCFDIYGMGLGLGKGQKLRVK